MSAVDGGPDRASAVARLRAALDDGYFDQQAYDSRVASVLAAGSQGEIERLMADVPAAGRDGQPVDPLQRITQLRPSKLPRALRNPLVIFLGFCVLTVVLQVLRIPLPAWWPLAAAAIFVVPRFLNRRRK